MVHRNVLYRTSSVLMFNHQIHHYEHILIMAIYGADHATAVV